MKSKQFDSKLKTLLNTKKPKKMNQLEALINHANSTELEGLKVHDNFSQDKRKTVKKFFLTLHGTTISPVLNYDNMNHFILGFSKAKKILINS